MKTFDLKCELCGIKVGEASFDDDRDDEECQRRCSSGQICSSCLPLPAENPAQPEE